MFFSFPYEEVQAKNEFRTAAFSKSETLLINCFMLSGILAILFVFRLSETPTVTLHNCNFIFLHEVALARRLPRDLLVFQSSCHLPAHLSTHHGRCFLFSLFLAERQAGKL